MQPPIESAAGPAGPESDPPTPPGDLREWDPHHRVALVLIVAAVLLRPFARLPGNASPWFEILATGLVVAVQYALLLWPFTGRTLMLLTASLIAILFGRRGLGRAHLLLFYVDLVLLLASAQAVAIGLWRFRRQRREQTSE